MDRVLFFIDVLRGGVPLPAALTALAMRVQVQPREGDALPWEKAFDEVNPAGQHTWF
jgi:hypothetical protein